MRNFSSAELANKTDAALAAAAPVSISHYGTIRFVVLSSDEYQRLTGRIHAPVEVQPSAAFSL